MVTKLSDENIAFLHFIDDSAFVVDTAGPIAGKAMFQRFGFTNAFKRRSLYFLDQGVDSLEDRFVGLLSV